MVQFRKQKSGKVIIDCVYNVLATILNMPRSIIWNHFFAIPMMEYQLRRIIKIEVDNYFIVDAIRNKLRGASAHRCSARFSFSLGSSHIYQYYPLQQVVATPRRNAISLKFETPGEWKRIWRPVLTPFFIRISRNGWIIAINCDSKAANYAVSSASFP